MNSKYNKSFSDKKIKIIDDRYVEICSIDVRMEEPIVITTSNVDIGKANMDHIKDLAKEIDRMFDKIVNVVEQSIISKENKEKTNKENIRESFSMLDEIGEALESSLVNGTNYDSEVSQRILLGRLIGTVETAMNVLNIDHHKDDLLLIRPHGMRLITKKETIILSDDQMFIDYIYHRYGDHIFLDDLFLIKEEAFKIVAEDELLMMALKRNDEKRTSDKKKFISKMTTL